MGAEWRKGRGAFKVRTEGGSGQRGRARTDKGGGALKDGGRGEYFLLPLFLPVFREGREGGRGKGICVEEIVWT